MEKTLKDYEYFRTNLGVLYHGDCLKILPLIDEKVDLVLTDPEYGCGKEYDKKMDTLDTRWFNLIPEETPKIFTPGIMNVKEYPQYDWILCWYKPGAMSRTKQGFNSWEPILLYNVYSVTRQPDVIKCSQFNQKGTGDHPTPKPSKLYDSLLMRYEKYGIRAIVDPFFGTGTLGVSCEKLNRKWIGIEILEKYCAIAKTRVKAEADQFKMEFE